MKIRKENTIIHFTTYCTYNHGSVTGLSPLLTILQILTYLNPIIVVAEEHDAHAPPTKKILEGAEVCSLKTFSLAEGRP